VAEVEVDWLFRDEMEGMFFDFLAEVERFERHESERMLTLKSTKSVHIWKEDLPGSGLQTEF
jgi:hypothetical protein